MPAIPPENGSHVSYRTIAFSDMAKRAWGQEWGVPDTVYVFSNGTKKESTDMTTSGIYTRR